MKVYSLLGVTNYEGSELVGVFASVKDVEACVLAGNGNWTYDDLVYVESELGLQIDDPYFCGAVKVKFLPYTGKKHG